MFLSGPPSAELKLKDETQEVDSVSEVTPLDRIYTCDCGHMEIEA
jgi:hypothetical protein